MTEFWKDMEIGARCIRYVEKRLEANERMLEQWVKEERPDRYIRDIRYQVALCEYALGKRSFQPIYTDYMEE